MFEYSLPEPLKSLYVEREHSRAQALPANTKCGDLSMGCLSPNCKMVVFLFLLFSVANSVVFWERNLTGLLHCSETVI